MVHAGMAFVRERNVIPVFGREGAPGLHQLAALHFNQASGGPRVGLPSRSTCKTIRRSDLTSGTDDCAAARWGDCSLVGNQGWGTDRASCCAEDALGIVSLVVLLALPRHSCAGIADRLIKITDKSSGGRERGLRQQAGHEREQVDRDEAARHPMARLPKSLWPVFPQAHPLGEGDGGCPRWTMCQGATPRAVDELRIMPTSAIRRGHGTGNAASCP